MILLAVTYGCNMLIDGSGIGTFIIRCIVSAGLPNILLLVIYGRTEECKYFYGLLMRKLRKQ